MQHLGHNSRCAFAVEQVLPELEPCVVAQLDAAELQRVECERRSGRRRDHVAKACFRVSGPLPVQAACLGIGQTASGSRSRRFFDGQLGG